MHSPCRAHRRPVAQDEGMDISSSTALVTGANRGLGRQFALELLRRGARVYAAARDPETVDVEGVTPIRLDVSDAASVVAAAEVARDVTLVVNNAGINVEGDLLTADLDDIRRVMDVNYFGALSVARSFVPVVERNGGGAVLNVLSVLSWLSLPDAGGYCASKAAAWSMTNALRVSLADRGIAVTALHVGPMDTDMMAGSDAVKSDPAFVAALALDGVAAGLPEVLADDASRGVQAGLSQGVGGIYPRFAR
jgi:NAD(P)-dependent dehydrogenase (short-subunit alcohol dehydrogenase family)